MEFIQKKTADHAVEHFLPKAADKGTKLAWDRFEGQLPECGFCESGLSCRDCLQGPCISHPFRDVEYLYRIPATHLPGYRQRRGRLDVYDYQYRQLQPG